jgi:hypothetical protein
MATINAPSLQDTVYSGDCPLAAAHGYITLASVPVADKIRLNKVYAGTKVYDVAMINAALGASTTVSLGFEYVNGESGGSATAFLPATSTSSAARVESSAKPVTLLYDAFIIATIGGATATGQIDTVVTYEFKGK